MTTFRLPAEWEPHVRTWMEFPPLNDTFGDDLDDCLERARHAAAWFRGDLGNESE